MHVLSLMFAACSLETNVQGKDADRFDDGTAPDAETDTDEPVESCNGVDDDADGDIDEGFDEDGNGRGDCLDDECPELSLGVSASVPIAETCLAGRPVSDPWNVVIEWQYDVAPDFGANKMPAVGNMTDDNGDGRIDERDVPDIAFPVYVYPGDTHEVLLVSGDGSGLLFRLTDMGANQGVAIADVDGDGSPEVLAFRQGERVVALDATGATRWESETFGFSYHEQITVADLDGDGVAEVIADRAILDGRDGSTIAWLDMPEDNYRSPIVADLDQDGSQEIVLGRFVFDATGARLWEMATAPSAMDSVYSAVVDADGDPGGEVVLVTNGDYILYDDDGTELLSASLPTTYPGDAFPGSPCVADFDGDGEPEMAVGTYGYLAMLELDGTLVWSMPTVSSGGTGCSGFDFDRDGAAEVVFTDRETFYVCDGRTGTPRFTWDGPGGGGFMYPVVADVDQDGSAEIVVPTSAGGGFYGLTVFGQADGTWPSAGPTWGVPDFSETRLDLDGGVPTVPAAPWLTDGAFRARPAGDGARADLTVDFTDACVMDCTYGPVGVALQVANQGAVDVAAGVEIQVWAVDADDTERLVYTTSLPAVPAGQRLDGMDIPLAPTDAGAHGFRAVIDPEDSERECDESNNTVRWTDVYCY